MIGYSDLDYRFVFGGGIIFSESKKRERICLYLYGGWLGCSHLGYCGGYLPQNIDKKFTSSFPYGEKSY